jgi:HEAT repeat protein
MKKHDIQVLIAEHLRKDERISNALARLHSLKVRTHVETLSKMAFDGSQDFSSRIDAIILILSMKSDLAIVLSRLLDSDDRVFVAETLKLIRDIKTKWAITELISRVKSDTDPSRRAMVAWSLAGYPNSSAVRSALLDVVVKDPDLEVRNHAIESLSEFPSPQVVEALLRVLSQGSTSERFWSLYSLGTLGDRRAIEAITPFLKDEAVVSDFGTIAAEAKWALNEISKHCQSKRVSKNG